MLPIPPMYRYVFNNKVFLSCEKSEINIFTKHFLSKKNILNNQKFNSPAVFISTWFGVGLVNPMSGTWGTLAGIPFAFLIMLYGFSKNSVYVWVYRFS